MDPFGDFQTPQALAVRAVNALVGRADPPATVVEPTCGRGAFLQAAAARFPRAQLIGFDRSPEHLAAARAFLPDAELRQADAFEVDWVGEAKTWKAPIWVVGNPPWVTAAALGRAGATSGPRRDNPGMKGLEALTGAANFDLSEWIWLRLMAALAGREALVALLCKTQTARRVLGSATPVGLWRIDARREFGVSAAAGLLAGRPGPTGPCPVFASLEAAEPEASWSVGNGVVTSGQDQALAGVCDPPWRSGVKHDCARVFELRRDDGGWRNGLGESVDIEADRLIPWVKGGDLHRQDGPERALVLTQRHPGDGTETLRETAPKTWAYLSEHAAAIRARRSRIWRTAPDFGLFGIGPYSFAPWKVAVSSLYPDLRFRLLGPRSGKPVMLDDTSYFLAFPDEAGARAALRRLEHPRARAFLLARTFPDAKRKVSRKALQQLDLERVAALEGGDRSRGAS